MSAMQRCRAIKNKAAFELDEEKVLLAPLPCHTWILEHVLFDDLCTQFEANRPVESLSKFSVARFRRGRGLIEYFIVMGGKILLH